MDLRRFDSPGDGERPTRWRMRSAAMRALPDFYVLGAQKAGTTSLFAYLAQLPDVAPPLRKEIQYFTDHFVRGERWYRAHFPLRLALRATGAATGEATPKYLFDPLAPARIRAATPRARHLVLLRDPVERALSHYFYDARRGVEALSLEEALDAEEREAHGLEPATPARWARSYLARGRYAEQVERLWAVVDRDRTLVLGSGELFARPRETLERVAAFLGLRAPSPRLDLAGRNINSDRGDVAPATRRRMERHFEAPNARLSALLGEMPAW